MARCSDEATKRRSDEGRNAQGAGRRAQGQGAREQGTGNREQVSRGGRCRSIGWNLLRTRAGAGLIGVLVLAALSAGCRRADIPPVYTVRVAGAQVAVEYVESWLRRSDDPRFVVERVGPAAYSQSGFEALARGTCDLACTDRTIGSRELPMFRGTPIAGQRIGFYGYALYVHPDNPLDSIFAKHLKLIFRRQVTDWSELGAGKGPIHLYGPRKSTRGGEILARQASIWFADATWTVLDSDLEIVRAVANDPLGLGFASIGYDHDVRYLGLRMERHGEPAFPSLEEIESERYGLAKVLYVYYRTPASEAVQAALNYLASDAGQRAMQRNEIWPIAPADRPVPILQVRPVAPAARSEAHSAPTR